MPTTVQSMSLLPYYLIFGRHPRLPIDVDFGLHKPNCSENCSKSRYIQKLRRRLNYAHKKASKYSSEQAQKYKTSYDRVTGTKVRTLHRNLLLPLGVKYQPDIDSDESDADDSVYVDTSHPKYNQPEKVDSQTT